MRSPIPIVAILLGLSALSTGCAEAPRMTLHHAEVRSASMYGIGLAVYMTVNNPNSFDIQIRNVRILVTFADQYALPEIVHSPNQWLPAGQSTVVGVPVTIPYVMIPNLARTTANLTTLRYHVKGHADVTATSALEVEKDNYPIDEGGAINRSDLLAAAGLR